MRLKLKYCVVCGSENGHGMAVGSMNPLDGVGWCQDGSGERSLALADLDAETSKND
jgi:hypothetical protein